MQLKFVLTAAIGFALSKKGMLDSHGSRTLSICVINVFFPALLFSKVVEGIDQDKIRQIGLLLATSLLYTLIGLVGGFIVRTCTKVPRCWQNGVLAAGAFGNWGDLPLVMIGTIASVAPFNGNSDLALGYAYISIFIFVQSSILFVFGGTWLVSSDFERSEADLEKPAVGLAERVRRLHIDDRMSRVKEQLHIKSSGTSSTATLGPDPHDVELGNVPTSKVPRMNTLTREQSRTTRRRMSMGETLARVRSNSQSSLCLEPMRSGVANPSEQFAVPGKDILVRVKSPGRNAQSSSAVSLRSSPSVHHDASPASTTPTERLSFIKRAWTIIKTGILRLLAPPSAAIILGFIVAIVPPIKALFVHVNGQNIPNGPDGKPPLDFLLDISNFIGGASVPSALLILGFSLSRLDVRKPPALTSALLMCLIKMAILPVLAVAWMQFLALQASWVADDRILRLSLVLPAACPTATAMLYLTQVFATEGRELELQCLSVFVITQYLVVGITMTVTVSYTLHLIVG